MSEPMLSIQGLTKRFGGVLATDNLEMSVHPGEIHAVIGPNGAGKTTLIGQLTGELIPDAGRIIFDGADLTREPVHKRAQQGLARSYQITQVFREFSALQNVAMAVQAHGRHSFRFWSPASADAGLSGPTAIA